jgi:heparan-alpha-glucosaminide N-acetyltransferase
MNNTSKIDFTQRNVGIDLLRALTMFVMIFVNDFWKIHDVPRWLDHAARGEDFMGLADVVFPAFLFVVGMSIPFAIERRYSKGLSAESTIGHIFSRTFALLVMGAFITNSEARLSPEVSYKIGVYWILMVIAFVCIWNQYPRTKDKNRKIFYTVLKVVGVLILFYLTITFRNPKGGLFAARWGILGSIGWAYLVCALIYVFSRDRLKYLIPVWIAFVIICILGSRMNEAWGGAAILELPRPNFYNEMLSILHIGNGALPAFTMGGVIFSLLSTKYSNIDNKKKIIYVASAVILFWLAGFIAREFWILSKLSATPTWVFYVIAIVIAVYALLTWLSDTGRAGWLNIIKPAGTATLTCYLVPYVSYGLADLTGIVLPDWFTHGFMGIINSLCFAFVIIGITWLLGRIHIKLKI